MKKILVLGGTGAMGKYLVPELSKMGYKVDVVALDENIRYDDANISYIKADARDESFAKEIVKNGYDAIVDFMIYSNPEFEARLPLFAENTEHYIFFSSYRVYANKDAVITEESPRLLDVSEDEEFLSRVESEYALYKAKQEDIAKESKYTNWTALRPAVTYSKGRYQLVTLEANILVYRAINNKKIIIPEDALNVQATMSWAGDVGKMIARLVLNENAYREIYTTSTSEHHTWGEIAGYYTEILGAEFEVVDTETYIDIMYEGEWRKFGRYQLFYDRYFDRIIDNSKILKATNMAQDELMPLKEGLKKELTEYDLSLISPNEYVNEKMDKYFENKSAL